MGISRLLLLLALAAVGYLAWMRMRDRLPSRRRDRVNHETAGGRMVRCTRCGLFVPEDEAVRGTRGEPYCSAEHRDAGDSER